MLKKISNVYNYLDYRVLLNDDFMHRTHLKHSYSLRAYARDLALSPGFLSNILKGHKEISPLKGREAFTRMGLAPEELDYAVKLILLRNADNEWAKMEAYNYVRNHCQLDGYKMDDSKDLIVASREHFLIYGIIRQTSELSKILQYTDQFAIPKEKVLQIISEYIEAEYIVDNGTTLVVSNKKLVIQNHQNVLMRVIDFADLIGKQMIKMGGMKVPEQVAHALVLGLDKQSFDLAVEAQKHYIKNLHRISEQSSSVDRFVFISDITLAIQQKKQGLPGEEFSK